MTPFLLFFQTLHPVKHPMQTLRNVQRHAEKQSLKGGEVSDLGRKKQHKNKVRVHLLASGQPTYPETGLNLPSTFMIG